LWSNEEGDNSEPNEIVIQGFPCMVIIHKFQIRMEERKNGFAPKGWLRVTLSRCDKVSNWIGIDVENRSLTAPKPGIRETTSRVVKEALLPEKKITGLRPPLPV